MTDTKTPATSVDGLSAAVAAPWRDFLQRFEPLQPDLYRYCRYLARSPWEADDLVQETLMRSFVALACSAPAGPEPPRLAAPRGVKTSGSTVRDAREVTIDASPLLEARAPLAVDPRATREAVGSLMATLSPQERAAVVLVEAFDLTLNEAAESPPASGR